VQIILKEEHQSLVGQEIEKKQTQVRAADQVLQSRQGDAGLRGFSIRVAQQPRTSQGIIDPIEITGPSHATEKEQRTHAGTVKIIIPETIVRDDGSPHCFS
jgi:hypothetical protein